MHENDRIYLASPNVGADEQEAVKNAIASGWVAPAGLALDAFEAQLAGSFSGKKVLCLNSGTSALHLALVLAGVGEGDEVVLGTFTFAACANAVRYQGATPIFMDSESDSWNLDPDLLEDYVNKNEKPKAVIVTHLYGVPAKMNELKALCVAHDIILIEDAAEAIGSTLNGVSLGVFGDFGILSFNGNKTITTGGGGALICDSAHYEKGLHLATQANRDPFGYDHDQVGYNYRLSNISASIGLAQLSRLESFLRRKVEIFDYYKVRLSSYFDFPNDIKGAQPNRWLTTPLMKQELFGEKSPLGLVKYLEQKMIQARQLWKPLHIHDAYSNFPFEGGTIADDLFAKGLCLPSGTALRDKDLDRVCEEVLNYVSDQ